MQHLGLIRGEERCILKRGREEEKRFGQKVEDQENRSKHRAERHNWSKADRFSLACFSGSKVRFDECQREHRRGLTSAIEVWVSGV